MGMTSPQADFLLTNGANMFPAHAAAGFQAPAYVNFNKNDMHMIFN